MRQSSSKDKIRTRTVLYRLKLIREHFEAMQRDAHGLEYGPWRSEVDELWKIIFEEINDMSEEFQQASLESIRELWVMYISHYAVIDTSS